jgi:YesN/AraC family two-component response regulator
MIVDDEKLTIEDLSTLVDWQAVGYRSSQYFSQAFQKKTGIFPKDYRRGEDVCYNGHGRRDHPRT